MMEGLILCVLGLERWKLLNSGYFKINHFLVGVIF